MKRKLHVIYITGLGDESPSWQRRVIQAWRLWGVEPELLQMRWSSDESWDKKFERLLHRIDELAVESTSIGLVGVSAGASAAINAYAARKSKIDGVVLIAGKVNRPDAVREQYRQKYPAMIESLKAAQKSLASLNSGDLQHILSRYALMDELVYKIDSRIPGAHNRITPIIGHIPMIVTQITLGAPNFLRFLKKQAKIVRH